MATYVIGDIQGCYQPLLGLLARIQFNPVHDHLWLTGDLVNRGPQSLEVLRWAIAQGDRITTVLGNHDLHLLGIAAGIRQPKRDDTLGAILQASDRDRLITWLRHQPVLFHDQNYLMVHAGLLPAWRADDAIAFAATAHAALQSVHWPAFLAHYFQAGKKADAQATHTSHAGDPSDAEHVAHALQVMTRIRIVNAQGAMVPKFSGPPADRPAGTVPWFDAPERKSADTTIVFGHWAALGLVIRPDMIACDTGCVWNHLLTAVRLADRAVFQQPAT